MRHGNRSPVSSLVALYALLLRLYPAAFRQTFGAEMVAVFRASLKRRRRRARARSWASPGAAAGLPRTSSRHAALSVNPGRRPGWRAWIAWFPHLAIPAAWAITFGGIWVAEAVIGQTMMH